MNRLTIVAAVAFCTALNAASASECLGSGSAARHRERFRQGTVGGCLEAGHAQAVDGPCRVDARLHHRRGRRPARRAGRRQSPDEEPGRHRQRRRDASTARAAGQQLTTLLKEHITIAVDLIKAAKAGDKAGQQQADSRWQQNAVQIADFLSKANPHWPKDVLTDLMKKHLSTTTN